MSRIANAFALLVLLLGASRAHADDGAAGTAIDLTVPLATADIDTSSDSEVSASLDTSPKKNSAWSLKNREPAQRMYIRAGLTHMHPFEKADAVVLSDIEGPASLAVEAGPVAGSSANVGNANTPSAIIGYVLPWLDGHLSAELVLGAPIDIEFEVAGTLANESIAPEVLGIPTGVPALGPKFGRAKAAPVVVTSVYRFHNALGPLTPYAGGGLSVLFTFDREITNPILTENGDPGFEVDPAFGVVGQAGIELPVWRWLIASVDLKYIAGMKARARVTNIVVSTPELPLFEKAEVGTAEMEMWVNPLVLQLGLGANF